MKIRSRQVVLVAAVLVSAFVSGCHNRSISQHDVLAGNYEYHLGNKAQGKVCFVLNSDGRYFLGDAHEPLSQPSMSGTSPHGKWELHSDTSGQTLIIGDSSLPIARTSSSIRVTVDDDLGMYCDLAVRR